MPLGKDKAGRTRGPSSAQRSVNASEAARHPLRKVIASGIAYWPDAVIDGRRYEADRDALECGHLLGAATDLVGRRYPARRRCYKCSAGTAPDFTPEQAEDWRL